RLASSRWLVFVLFVVVLPLQTIIASFNHLCSCQVRMPTVEEWLYWIWPFLGRTLILDFYLPLALISVPLFLTLNSPPQLLYLPFAVFGLYCHLRFLIYYFIPLPLSVGRQLGLPVCQEPTGCSVLADLLASYHAEDKAGEASVLAASLLTARAGVAILWVLE